MKWIELILWLFACAVVIWGPFAAEHQGQPGWIVRAVAWWVCTGAMMLWCGCGLLDEFQRKGEPPVPQEWP